MLDDSEIHIEKLSVSPLTNQFENHGASLISWYSALKERIIEKGAFLIFIDWQKNIWVITIVILKVF